MLGLLEKVSIFTTESNTDSLVVTTELIVLSSATAEEEEEEGRKRNKEAKSRSRTKLIRPRTDKKDIMRE